MLRKIFLILMMVLAFAVLMPAVLFAQTEGGAPGFDWGQLGVNVTIVTVILTFVQAIKKFLPQNTVVWAPFIISVIISALYGAVTHTGDIIIMLKMAFVYAAAAAWLYDIGNSAGLLKSRNQFT